MMVSGRPPQRSVSTGVRPITPPFISTKKNASTASHSPTSQGFQKVRTQLATSSATSAMVAISGRHCWSNG